MKIVIQRVSRAKVSVEGKVVGEISKGLLLLIGIGTETEEKNFPLIAEKILNLRIFEDKNGKMNLSLLDIQGEILGISQFTLYASLKKGRRPDFFKAAPTEKAKALYENFLIEIKKKNVKVEQGIFGASMQVDFINDGPVTIVIDEKDFL